MTLLNLAISLCWVAYRALQIFSHNIKVQPASSALVLTWLFNPEHLKLMQESAWLQTDRPLASQIRVCSSVPRFSNRVPTYRWKSILSAWCCKRLVLTHSSHQHMFSCYWEAAYGSWLEFILMNEGALWCCNSVIAGPLTNHPLLSSRTGNAKYIKGTTQHKRTV